ncbi:hypothetical protein RJO15_17315 [Herbaspirillum huttiense F1]|jgi:hypothetical protein|uniref:hypothetical protein n=1 Tax=Herbaspirillum huttiense TaxID=863372 RepID=UPI001066286D|nr:hypothetical protein [Herbaspirillum huttiense]MDT0357550.1 hypothetical protein [Herbaspirillum huttiense F1]
MPNPFGGAAMNMEEDRLMVAWCEELAETRRLTVEPTEEGWRARLDGFPMSYGETVGAAVMWTFIMSHKSAYE